MKTSLALLAQFVALTAMAQTATVTPNPVVSDTLLDLYRGSTIVTRDHPSLAACVAAAQANTITRAAGANYSCRAQSNFSTTFVANPCPAQPATQTRTQTCTAPLVGSWTQTLTYTAAPAPTCWIAGAWVPSTSPAGACVDAPPPPPPPSGMVSIWPTAIPGQTSTADSGAVNLGVQFTSSLPGTINGVRFYKGAGNTGTHVGSLWGSAGLLAQAAFTGETATGWQQVTFASPVSITAGATYTASYHAPVGRYAINSNFAWPVVAGPLTAKAGTFAYASQSAYPSSTWNASNYWVDVLFTPGSLPPPPPPAVGTAEVAWNASIGTAETSLEGYRVYWRKEPATGYQQARGAGVFVVAPSYYLGELALGVWCFSVTALGISTSDGQPSESDYSVEACKTIP